MTIIRRVVSAARPTVDTLFETLSTELTNTVDTFLGKLSSYAGRRKGVPLPSHANPCGVRRGEGREKLRSLTLVLDGTNPRFPWKPSATMLTYRLTGTTEESGSTTTNATSLRPTKWSGTEFR